MTGTVGPVVVRQLLGPAVPDVRRRVRCEAHGADGRPALEQRAGDAVHPVHDAAVGAQDHGVRGIDVPHEPHVVDDLPVRGRIVPGLPPVRRVQFPHGVQRDVDDRQVGRQPDQPVHVPRVEPPLAGPEVVLLPHQGFLVTRISVPGTSAPRAGDHWPQFSVRPGVHSGSTRSASTSPAPTTARTQSPTVRWCSTYTVAPESSVSTYGVRSKYEDTIRRSLGSGESGKGQRIGWLTEATKRPPGRSTRSTSASTAPASATNGSPPYAEQARSKEPSARGSAR